RRAMLAERTPDPGMRRLRKTMAAATAPRQSDASADARQRVEVLLDQQRHRFHRQPVPTPTIPRFAAVEETMATLSRYFSQPTGLAVLTVNRADPTLIDIDHSTLVSEHLDALVAPGSGTPTVLARAGRVAALVGGNAYTVNADLSGRPRRIGEAQAMFAA